MFYNMFRFCACLTKDQFSSALAYSSVWTCQYSVASVQVLLPSDLLKQN